MNTNFSESKARDAVLESKERLHDSRRNFFKTVGVGATAAGGIGAMLHSAPAFAYGGPYAAAFGLDPGRTFMNVGTTGSTPIAVLKSLAANNAAVARDPTLTFNTADMRNSIAQGFGADPFEIVISGNTTDGMNKLIGGIDWKVGDEIITTNMEHPGGDNPMNRAVDRYGVVLRRINLPTNDAYSDAAVLARFQAAVTNKTRAICFSSPPYLTGIRLNEKQLCLWAASQGYISIVDGAHGPGMLNLNFHDMGVDFYAGSGHKWQCGPGGTGYMYVRNGVNPNPYTKTVTIAGQSVTLTLPGYSNTTPLTPFWTVDGGYSPTPGSALNQGIRDPEDNIAASLMSIGNPSYPALRAAADCCAMWDAWGRQNIENYIVTLAQYLRSRIAGIWGQQSMGTPYDGNTPNHARIALTSFNPFSPGADYNAVLSAAEATAQTTASAAALTALRNSGIVVRNTSVPHGLRGNPTQNASGATNSHPLRISTHLFHNSADVDNLVAALQTITPAPRNIRTRT